MGAENNSGVIGYIIQFFNKNRAKTGQAIYHETVVHNFVANINGRTEQLERAFNNFYCPVDPGTKPTRIGQYNFHQFTSVFLADKDCSKASSNSRITPQVIAESARLNAG